MTAPVTIVNEIDGIKARLDALQANLDKQVADHAAAHSKALAAGVDNEIALRLIALGWTPPPGFPIQYFFVICAGSPSVFVASLSATAHGGRPVETTDERSAEQFHDLVAARFAVRDLKDRYRGYDFRAAVCIPHPSPLLNGRVIEVPEAQ